MGVTEPLESIVRWDDQGNTRAEPIAFTSGTMATADDTLTITYDTADGRYVVRYAMPAR